MGNVPDGRCPLFFAWTDYPMWRSGANGSVRPGDAGPQLSLPLLPLLRFLAMVLVLTQFVL